MSTISTSNNSPASESGARLLPSKRGGQTCSFNGRFYHSAYDPEKEAAGIIARLNGKKAALIIGAGLGYISRAWSASTKGAPALELFLSTGIRNLRDRAFPGSPPGAGQITATDFPGLRAFLRSLDHTALSNLAVIENPAAAALFPDTVKQVREETARMTAEILSDRFTEWEFQRIWFRNILRNIPSIINGTPFLRYMNSASGTAVITGAGPSLSETIPLLDKLAGTTPIFAADTALPALLDAGIHPDWVVSLDGQIHNLRDFNGIPTEELKLLTDPTVYHAIPPLPFREVVFFETAEIIASEQGQKVLSHPLILWIKQCLGEIGPVASGGNVTTTAMALATAMGYTTLLLAGVDNSFPGISYHCRGSYTHRIDCNRSDRIHTLEDAGLKRIRRRKRIPARDYRGRKLNSDPMLQKFALWSRDAVRTAAGEISWFSLSGQSLFVEGIPFINNGEALALAERQPGTRSAPEAAKQNSTEGKNLLKERLRSLRKAIRESRTNELNTESVAALFGNFPFLNRVFEKQLLHIEKQGLETSGDFLRREIRFQLDRIDKQCALALSDL